MKFKNVKRGWRTINRKRIYFDSKAEANYYRYLLFLKKNGGIVDFKYHPPYFDFSKWIKYGTRRYELDFWVKEKTGKEKWIEIKGTDVLSKMDSKSRTRINRLRKYYPEAHLDVISTKRVAAIGKQTLGLIPDWE